MTLKHWAVLLLTATLLGSSFVQIKVAVAAFPPMMIATLRAMIAAPLVLMFLRYQGGKLPALGRDWKPLLVIGVLGAAIPFAAIASGQERIASGLGGVLFGSIPILSIVLVPLLIHDERFTVQRLSGAFIGLLGVIVVIGPGAFSGNTSATGVGVTLLAALSYTLSGIYARQQKHISAATLAAGQLVVATVLLTPLTLVVGLPESVSPNAIQTASVLGVAILSTAVPTVLLFWLVRETGPTNTSLVALFIPVVAVILGTLLFDETLSLSVLVGLGLITTGALIVSQRFQTLPKQIQEEIRA